MQYLKPIPQEDGSIEFVVTDEPQEIGVPAQIIEPPFDVLRMNAYPSIGDQLDMLWHAMNQDETKRLEPFYSTVKAVKDSIPKP